MFTANSIFAVFALAIVVVFCATPGRGAPSMASTLHWGPEQSQPNHWDFSQSDLTENYKFADEHPSELKPYYWQRVLKYLSEVPVPSLDLQPPPLPPSGLSPPPTPKPDDQSSGEQVPFSDLENQITQTPDLNTDDTSNQESDEQITDQSTEQVTDQATEPSGQATSQAIEQVTNYDSNYDVNDDLSYTPETVNVDDQTLYEAELEQYERKHAFEKFLKFLLFLERTPYESKNLYNDKEREIGESNSLWRLRRSVDDSSEYSDSDEHGTRYSQAGASAGSGHYFPTFPDHQGYIPSSSEYLGHPDLSLRSMFGGYDVNSELPPQADTGISTMISGPYEAVSSWASSSDDGNGKKTNIVATSHS